jgi:ERCC4-related helicase
MTNATSMPQADDPVLHEKFGLGRLVTILDETVIARFGETLHQLPTDQVTFPPSLKAALRKNEFHGSDFALQRAQALAIKSVNDQWGVFTRSRVQLLPHQLWVCKTVTQSWPVRWLVADDVGLGKTIECGLVLMPLISSGRIRRLLILAPAKLVPQWQARLKEMFDIRLQQYAPEVDDAKGSFWASANMVVASFHTLRDDRRGARTRVLDAEAWDMVVVDEAHHLGLDKRTGPTLARSLVAELAERQKLESLLLFTGTPHKGKDYAFLGLMQLLRPETFDPNKSLTEQLPLLAGSMIRNNKSMVTDLKGNTLFTKVSVSTSEFTYTQQEQNFYDLMSGFILDGRAYASNLSGRAATARMLVLTTLQKLAASSIAAIKAALIKRIAALKSKIELSNEAVEPQETEQPETLDEVAEFEVRLATESAILLINDEVSRLEELVAIAQEVETETKISRLITMIDSEMPPGEPVLLFTEYKATQALVINALHARFGYGCASFINGDERLEGVQNEAGDIKVISAVRQQVADNFNDGKIRFLVSTEAGGEGIDLQERCATLIHVDMPWNPMRLHQRVGRISRYGQKRDVNVHILRNPETVEARIWDLLNQKLDRIQATIDSVMPDREDIRELVIGMTENGAFDSAFSGAVGRELSSLHQWFDQETKSFGGDDIVSTVRSLIGSVAAFDFQKFGKDMPQVDLPDLEPFFRSVLTGQKRRLTNQPEGLEVVTPDVWRKENLNLRTRYQKLTFDRHVRGEGASSRIIGVGHPLVDHAIKAAAAVDALIAQVDGFEGTLLIVSVEDVVTGQSGLVHRMVFGFLTNDQGEMILRDWELLLLLNKLKPAAQASRHQDSKADTTNVDHLVEKFNAEILKSDLGFRIPVSIPMCLLLGENSAPHQSEKL